MHGAGGYSLIKAGGLLFHLNMQIQRKQMHAKGEENKPGDEEAVCVRLFQIF
jgi:hypothetical protein